MTPPARQWLNDPASPVSVARVETAVFPELYEGKRMESRVFLEVARDAPASNVRLPADPQGPMAPWAVASNLAQAFAGLGRDAMRLAQSMRIFPVHPGGDPGLVSAMLERLAPAFAPGGTGFILNSVNLKQSPRSDNPKLICYQALTNGPMHATAVNGGGLLGEERTFLGDLSGGYTIALHKYSSLPIARTLGLEVEREWRGDGVDVASLKPVMPFWVNVNVKYEQGVNLAWRTRSGIWRGANGAPLDPPYPPDKPADAPRFNTTTGSSLDNITGPFHFAGTTVRVLPLLACRKNLEEFLKTRINDALDDSADPGNRRRQPGARLALWARPAPPPSVDTQDPQATEVKSDESPYAYIYLTATSLGDVTSGTNNVGDWAKYELSFLIPVKWEKEHEDGRWTVKGVGLFPAFSFVDNAPAAVSRSEVLGIPTNRAAFVSPENVWLKEADTDLGVKQTLVRMDIEVFPAIGVGQQAAMHPVVEIIARDNDAGIGDPASRATPLEWAEILRSELEAKKAIRRVSKKECKTARALALELLGNKIPVSLFALKQVRDVVDPSRACYQSLVRVSRMLEEIVDLREIEETLRVRIHDFPTFNPVESLGIVAKRLREEGSGIIYATQAVRPFYIRATLHEGGERLLSRSGTRAWKLGRNAFRSLLSDDGPMITVDRMAAHMQDQGNPSLMNSVTRRSAERRRSDEEVARDKLKLIKERKDVAAKRARQPTKELKDQENRLAAREEELELQSRITKPEATTSLARVDPQTVIESILSREWGSVDENARWRRGRQDLLRIRETMLAGGSIQFTVPPTGLNKPELKDALRRGRLNFVEIEKALYESVSKDKVNRPGRPPLERPEVRQMIDQMRIFTMGRLEIECEFNILAASSILEAAGRPPAYDSIDIGYATAELVRDLELINRTPVIGEPVSEQLDPRVPAGKGRLDEIVQALLLAFKACGKTFVRKETFFDVGLTNSAEWSSWNSFQTSMAKGLRDLNLIEKRFEEQVLDELQQLTGLLREAVYLATQYCNVQQAALLNKLSRGYQKPDFCIRRDALGRERDRLLPLSQSWDEEWYFGPTSKEDADDGAAKPGGG